MQSYEIKDVPFENVVKDLYKYPTHFMVANYNVNTGTGELVEDTILPSVFNKYVPLKKAFRRGSNKSEPFQRLGHNNQYPFFLRHLLTSSYTHKRAWTVCRNMAMGEGWIGVNSDGENFLTWLKTKGLNYKFTKKALEHISAFGGVYAKMIFVENQTGITNRKVLERIEACNYFDHRIGKEEERGEFIGEVLYYWFHPAYNATKWKKEFLQGIPVYRDIQDVQEGKRGLVKHDKKTGYHKRSVFNKNRYIHLIGEPAITSKYYPSATYETDGAIDAIKLESALSAFFVAGLENGLTAGYIVTMPLSDTSRRDKDAFERKKLEVKKIVEDKLKGAENNQRIIVAFQDPKDKSDGIKIAPIPHTNTSDMHKMMSDTKRMTILSAWGIPDSRLVGLPPLQGVGFTNQSEVLKTSEEIMYTLTVFPEVITPLENYINNELKEWYEFETGQTSDAEVKLKRKTIINDTPSDDILFSDFTRNERRKRYGAEPLTEAQERELENAQEVIEPPVTIPANE